MKTALLASLLLQVGDAPPPKTWLECEFETAQRCDPDGCKPADPTYRVWVADYAKDDGGRGGYYYRCSSKERCSVIDLDDFWAGVIDGYRVWLSGDKIFSTHVGPDRRVMDVVTLRERVLISRGTCRDAPPPILQMRTN